MQSGGRKCDELGDAQAICERLIADCNAQEEGPWCLEILAPDRTDDPETPEREDVDRFEMNSRRSCERTAVRLAPRAYDRILKRMEGQCREESRLEYLPERWIDSFSSERSCLRNAGRSARRFADRWQPEPGAPSRVATRDEPSTTAPPAAPVDVGDIDIDALPPVDPTWARLHSSRFTPRFPRPGEASFEQLECDDAEKRCTATILPASGPPRTVGGGEETLRLVQRYERRRAAIMEAHTPRIDRLLQAFFRAGSHESLTDEELRALFFEEGVPVYKRMDTERGEYVTIVARSPWAEALHDAYARLMGARDRELLKLDAALLEHLEDLPELSLRDRMNDMLRRVGHMADAEPRQRSASAIDPTPTPAPEPEAPAEEVPALIPLVPIVPATPIEERTLQRAEEIVREAGFDRLAIAEDREWIRIYSMRFDRVPIPMRDGFLVSAEIAEEDAECLIKIRERGQFSKYVGTPETVAKVRAFLKRAAELKERYAAIIDPLLQRFTELYREQYAPDRIDGAPADAGHELESDAYDQLIEFGWSGYVARYEDDAGEWRVRIAARGEEAQRLLRAIEQVRTVRDAELTRLSRDLRIELQNSGTLHAAERADDERFGWDTEDIDLSSL